MRVAKPILVTVFLSCSGLWACGGISDCKEDGTKCAAMLAGNAEGCAAAFKLRQGEPKRKHCENAIKVVGKQAVTAAVPALVEILKVPETSIPDDGHRQQAAKALAKIGDKSAVTAMIEAVTMNAGTSSDPLDKNANNTNEALAEALGELGDQSACSKLVAMMQGLRHNYTVLKSVRSLGELKCKDAVEAVSQVALEHDNKFMRKNAVEALGEIGDLSATDTLIQMMFVEYKGVSFYREASFALFKLGPGVADALLETMAGKNEKVQKYFEQKGGLQETAVKAKCGFVLGDLRDERAAPALMEAFEEASKKQFEDVTARILMTYASAPLGMLGDKKAVNILKKEMLILDASVRDPIMRAVVQLGDRSVVKEMIEGMTREHFIQACVKAGADQSLCEEDEASYIQAAKAATDHASNLAGADDLEAYKAAVDAMKVKAMKEYATERMKRVEAAGECKTDAACWVKKLKDKEPLVREKAAWELSWLKDKSTIGALAEALGDKDPYVRSAAISAYFVYGDKSAVPAIEKRLKDEKGSATFIKVNEDLKRLLVHLRRT